MKRVKTCCSLLSLVFLTGVFSFKAQAIGADTVEVAEAYAAGVVAVVLPPVSLRVLLSQAEGVLKDPDKSFDQKETFLISVSNRLNPLDVMSQRRIRNTFRRLNDDLEITPQIKDLFELYSLVL